MQTETIITLNGNEFRVFNDKLFETNENKLSNKKKYKQNLYSWKWFYSPFETNLMVSRYHKINQNKNGENIIIDKYINDDRNSHYGKAITYSQRFKQERLVYNSINQEINQIQEKDKLYYESLKNKN